MSHAPLGVEAAQRFLQTVVVIDDNAYSGLAAVEAPASLGTETLEPMTLAPRQHAAASRDEGSGEADEHSAELLDTQAIVLGFAELGMTAAVLAPDPHGSLSDNETLCRIAIRADVLVLDWIIRSPATDSDSSDRTSLPLLVEVLKADFSSGSRLRLTCIYTGEPDVEGVLEGIEAGLSAEFPLEKVQRHDSTVNIGRARIVVIPKAGGSEVPGLVPVTESELPSVVVAAFHEFAAAGLLPQLALVSLSVIREQAHRLLTRFSAALDPALLAHRAMTSPVATEQFVVGLIGDELASMVASEHVTACLADDVVSRVVDTATAGRTDFYWWKDNAVNATTNTLSLTDVQRLYADGVDQAWKIAGSERRLSRSTSPTSLLLEGDAASVRALSKQIDLQFAALSSLSRDARHEGSRLTPPEMQLGALLGEMSKGGAIKSLLICIQPLCDGLRLTEPTRFPFIPINEAGTDLKKFQAVAFLDEYLELAISKTKLSEVEFVKFRPQPSRSAVVAKWSDGAWRFRSTGRRRFVWLGNLRLDKAQKVVHQLVTDAGRVAINEYDFLRRIGGG